MKTLLQSKLLLLFFSFSLLVASSCTPPANSKAQSTSISEHKGIRAKKTKRPKNVILLIGDGMGITQISAGMYSNGDSLELERIKNIGLHKSYASNDLITDSAAGATAFSCGVKTYNGAIGVDADKKPVTTLLELAEKDNRPTGLVATSTITHATPGSFIAHVDNRAKQEEIATYFIDSGVDLFIGGGKKFFDRRKNDKRNINKELEEKGYLINDYFGLEIEKLPLDTDKNIGYFTADDGPLPVSKGRTYLPFASKFAAEFLDKRATDNGFFLMVEGSQIDWGGHANKADYIVSEMLDFNQVIKNILDFAEKDGETLVVITADHETGGMAINKGSTRKKLKVEFTSDYHTADLIPVFAFGPGSEDFRGIYENTAIFHKIKALMNL